MIAKRVHSRGKRNFGDLARYCRDADHAGEKCLVSWHAGCWAEEYDLAIAEIEATQEINSRAKSDKTYHLIISFRPEDEARLTPDAFKAIEEHCAAALGLSEHQRCCGVHKNTNNLHLHIAYNLIHPEKLTMATSLKGDFFKLSEACRAMEIKLGLVVDNGMEARGDKHIVQRAEAMEAHSGEQSFQSFALNKKEAVLAALADAQDWQTAHRVFAQYGMEIRPQGNGFAIFSQGGKDQESIKASALDRSLSKSKLVKRFGEYVKPERQAEKSQAGVQGKAQGMAPPAEKYERKPIQPKSLERDRLWQEFQALSALRKAAIEAEKARNKEAFGQLKVQWARGQEMGARLSMMRHIQKQDVAKAKAENQKRMAEIRGQYPYHNWNGFLQYRAEYGNPAQAKAALSVLRSREEKATAVAITAKTAAKAKGKTWLNVPYAARDVAKEVGARWDRAEKRWYAPSDADLGKFAASMNEAKGTEKPVASQPPKYIPDGKLTPSARIERLQVQESQRIAAEAQDKPLFAGCKQRIDNRGVVIITLASGGMIRDAGAKIHFSKDSQAQEAASLYALAKFGKHCKQEGTTIRRLDGNRPDTKPNIGILRESARNGLRQVSELPLVLDRKKQNTELLLPAHAQPDLER
ncbi:MAG TPA: hypothetical protein DEB25_09085 [Desulfobulbaceae bacterium]|nr:hypothetical protein [Desulfobulbaceae bacterium]